VRSRGVAERIGAAHDHAQLARADQLEQLGERLGQELVAADAVHQPEAHYRPAARLEPGGLDLARLVRGLSVDDEPAERPERAERLAEDVAADHLEHHVDALAAVGLDQPRRQSVGVGRHRLVGAQLERQRALLVRGRRCDHTGARAARELDGERPDAARRGVHDDRLPRLDAAACADQVPGGHALHGERERGAIVHAVGHRPAQRLVRDRVLRVPAVAGERNHALPRVVADAGHLAARHVGQLGRDQVRVGAAVRVREVHARARHVDQYLARAGLRGVEVHQLEDLRAAELADLDGAHPQRTQAPWPSL
jgi:hypothetical protein